MVLDPAYRALFADGSSLDVHSNPDQMAAAIESFACSGQAAGYRRLRDWLTHLYRIEFDGFIETNFDSPLALLTPRLARWWHWEDSAAGMPWSGATSPTRGCGECSPSSHCMPV